MNPDEAVLLFVDEYSRMAEAYDAHVVPRFAPFTERLVERAGLAPNATVLDVSAGTGNCALRAAKALGGTGLVVAIDLADGALAIAQTRAAREGLRNLRFEMLDSRNIVYRQQTFDRALTSFGVPAVGHAQVFREVHRVLKEGGAFHALEWAPRDAPSGWNVWDDTLAPHRTGKPSKVLAQLREAADLIRQTGDFDAIRDAATVTAKLEAAGFRDVRAEPYAAPVDFASAEELIAFRGAFGPTERELAEMDAASLAAFRRDLIARLGAYRHGDGYRFHWSVVYYDAVR